MPPRKKEINLSSEGKDQRTKRVRLTEQRVQSLQSSEGGKSQYLWDSETTKFGVRAVGRQKYYIVQCRLNGNPLQLKIGDLGEFATIEDARDAAKTCLAMIRRGEDPREHRRQIAVEQAAAKLARQKEDAFEQVKALAVGEIWAEYLEERRPYWGHRHYLDHVRLAQNGGDKAKKGEATLKPGPLAPLMRLSLVELNAERIEAWLKKESDGRPTQARLAYGSLKTFLNWCGDHQKYSAILGPDVLSRRIKNIVPKKSAKADSLQKEQLGGWFAAVRQIQNPVIAAYLQALLLTGARREELAGLRWDDVDFRWKSMSIKDKVEGERTIPLTPFVELLLQFLPRRNQWVFSSPAAASGRIQEPRIAHNKALAIAGIEGLTLHGLRRSFGSLSEWVELPTGIVAQIMGHKPSATAERHYRVRPLDLLRQWHIKLEAWILAQAGIVIPADSEKREQLRLVAHGG